MLMSDLSLSDRLKVFVEQLRTSGYGSVDQFLEQRPQFTDIGTLSIAAVLLPCESHEERLFPPGAPERDHWYETLVRLLSVGDRNYLQNHVTIVTYNYDRSLEYYLYSVMRTRLGRTHGDKIARHLAHVPVLHVHGKLGEFGSNVSATARTVPYGTPLDAESVQIAAREIRVIHRANPDTPEFVAVRRALREAGRIYFMGFGYNPTNLDRLQVFRREWSVAKRAKCVVQGTSLGMSAKDWERTCKVAMCGNMLVRPRYRQTVNTFLHNAVTVD